MIKVSAIITTHNRKDLLIKAVESVLNQTYRDIECIIVDDASTDGTESLLKETFNSKKYKYIYITPQETCGGNHARNVGVDAATGELIAFLDDDDEWLPTKIEKQVDKIIKNKSIGFVYCGRIFETNYDVKSRVKEDINAAKYKEGDLSKEVLVHVIGVTSTLLVRKKLILQVGGFDETLKAWQEYDLCIRLLQKTRVALVRECLVLYRIIKSDNTRNTNSITKWLDSSSKVEAKYKGLYSQLSPLDMSRHQLYKTLDGFSRARNAKDKKQSIKYAILLFRPNVALVAIKKKLRPELGL